MPMLRISLFGLFSLLLSCGDRSPITAITPAALSSSLRAPARETNTDQASVMGHVSFHPLDQGVRTASYTIEAIRRDDGSINGRFTLRLLERSEQHIEGDVVCFTLRDNSARVAVRVESSDYDQTQRASGRFNVRAGDYLGFAIVVRQQPGSTSPDDRDGDGHRSAARGSADQTSFFSVGDERFAKGYCAGSQTGTLYRVTRGHIALRGASTPPTVITGLDFQGNVSYPYPSPSTLFVFNQAISGTTPMAPYPATYIWRAYPRNNLNYWSGLFHANYTTGEFDASLTYYGMHPYPHFAEADQPPHWEISMGGSDVESDNPIVVNQWYTQVVTTTDGYLQTFYWNWPNMTTDVLTAQDGRKPLAPNPAIIIGDAPWNAGYENYSGVIRGLQFYDVVLTPDEIQREIDNPGSVRKPWYLNLNPTPADISDQSGNGHHPAWVGTNRPALWTTVQP